MIEIDPRALAQLLGRPVRPILTDAVREALRDRVVLITGAGGSIGSELARQVAACGPRALTLLEQSEYSLFRIEGDLRARHPDLAVHAVLGDVTLTADVRAAFACDRPAVVLHAAAYKHVTMAERAIVASARVNVLGTVTVRDAARHAGAHLVLVSTDKAAQPASVMGATKRFAEMLVLADGAGASVVRFGNVLGSSGSVLELMMNAARRGEPIPVTDPGATRYFMTASEAVSLVLTAGCARGAGDVFWVDMGEPMRIGDLAARVEQWALGQGFPAAGVRLIGLRAGEKLDEQLTTHGLSMTRTGHPHVWTARQPTLDRVSLGAALNALRSAVAAGDASRVLEALVDGVPDFIPAADTCARMWPTETADPAAGVPTPNIALAA
ncbi:MAG: polysaccharide biosynthesis protein [Vicinamibacterales bacterium]